MADMLNARERTLRAAVEVHTLHGTLHALVEVCYRKAERLEAEPGSEPSRKAENWKRIAQRLTAVEAEAAKLDF